MKADKAKKIVRKKHCSCVSQGCWGQDGWIEGCIKYEELMNKEKSMDKRLKIDKRLRKILENLAGIGKDCKPRMSTDQALFSIKAEVVKSLPSVEDIIEQICNDKDFSYETFIKNAKADICVCQPCRGGLSLCVYCQAESDLKTARANHSLMMSKLGGE